MAASAFSSSWSWRKIKPPASIALASSSPSPSPSQSQSPSPSPSPSTDSKTYKRVVNVPKLSTDEPRLLLPEKKALLSTPERVKWKERVRLGAQIESEKRNRSLKSLFGRRSLWRRIFSASKKVRSIILLNVITVVYGWYCPSSINVIVVPVLDGMFGAVVPPLTWFGAVLSVAGVAMLESSGSPPCVGDLFNFLGAIFFGIHMLRTERISRATTKENFIPLLGYEVGLLEVPSMQN
ncbi:hypothetical protein Cgig2_000387 [Carnegiea gigantea]|uniref:Uncharacterized protein n=1 Tax=Carnegiea gigantea TaxID=171969 RepID=A0A9Q1QD39_9CARY|nr:hypothetical protein Cgig2_000387 [Carnegiea gigantea]